MYKKLFIPGPTHVRDKILQAQAVPMIGHRAKEYADLQAAVTPKLQKLLYTEQRVYLYASSSTGVMEGAVRQASTKKVLNCICGAFSKRWHQITKANGVPCDAIEVPMGQATTPEAVDEALSKGEYDAITVVLNETSTGLTNPVKEIAALVREKYPVRGPPDSGHASHKPDPGTERADGRHPGRGVGESLAAPQGYGKNRSGLGAQVLCPLL